MLVGLVGQCIKATCIHKENPSDLSARVLKPLYEEIDHILPRNLENQVNSD